MNQDKRDNQRVDWWLAALLAACSLVFLLAYAHRADPAPLPDVERYIHVARAIGSFDLGEAVNYHYPPLFPAAIALVGAFTDDLESAARAVAIVSAAAAVVPVYFLALTIFGRRAAVIASSLIGLRFIAPLSQSQAEQLFILVLSLSLLCGMRALSKRRAGWFLVTGLLFGAAFLAKAEGFAYFIIYFAIVVLRGFRLAIHREAPAGSAALSAAALLVGYFMVAGPYLVRYHQDTGEFSFNPKARTLFHIHNYLYWDDGLYRIQKDDHGWFTQAQRIYIEGDKVPPPGSIAELFLENPMMHIERYPARFASSADENLRGFYLSGLAPYAWPALFLLGLWPGRGAGRGWRLLYLHAFAAAVIVAVPFYSVVYPRFYFSLLPWMAVVMGGGAARLIHFGCGGLDDNRRDNVAGLIVLSAVFLISMSAVVLVWRSEPDVDYLARVEFDRSVAADVKSMLPDGCSFMAELGNPSLWYLAGLPPQRQVILPAHPIDQTVVYAVATGSKLIVFHKSPFQERYQDLFGLLDRGFLSPLLKLRSRRTGTGGVHVIYEVTAVECGAARDYYPSVNKED